MIRIKNVFTKLKLFFILILILIALFYSLKNGAVVTAKFFFSNITIRQVFFEENKINHKGSHDPDRRFFNLLYDNYNDFKNFRFLKLINKIDKIKNIDIMQTEYYLEYELINKLKELSKIPIKEKKFTAIYIPKKLKIYMDLSCDQLMIPFIVPAISNIVLINGLPIEGIKSCFGHRREYGYSRYMKYNKSAKIENLDSQSICKLARNEGLKRVIELSRLEDKYTHIVHNCDN